MRFAWSGAAVAVVVTGLLALPVGVAGAEPSTPVPAPSITPAQTSSTDELADMVLDALEGGSSAPTTTVPAPAPLPLPPSCSQRRVSVTAWVSEAPATSAAACAGSATSTTR